MSIANVNAPIKLTHLALKQEVTSGFKSLRRAYWEWKTEGVLYRPCTAKTCWEHICNLENVSQCAQLPGYHFKNIFLYLRQPLHY